MPEESSRDSGSSELSQSALDKLTDSELWWRDHQVWLAELGYMLRPRYRPGWEPSWKAHPKKFPFDFEDWNPSGRPNLLDAVRLSDSTLVALKQVKKSWNPVEVEIAEYLSSSTLREDPCNHSVPIWEVFGVPDDPDITILVMPLLRACNRPAWETVGEVVSFIHQVFEGMQFMHKLHVAHRDCMEANIMYDARPMYPRMYHPRDPDRSLDFKGKAGHTTRTVSPVKYYFIDFGLSRRYSPEDGPPREDPIRGGDKSVPEFQDWNGEPLDPFPTDIYYLGNMIHSTIIQRFRGVEFLNPLIEDMVQAEPGKRPTIEDVVSQFNALLKPLGQRTLRSRLRPVNEEFADSFFRNIRHVFRTIRYVLSFKPAIPPSP